jgi:hypothetical protein
MVETLVPAVLKHLNLSTEEIWVKRSEPCKHFSFHLISVKVFALQVFRYRPEYMIVTWCQMWAETGVLKTLSGKLLLNTCLVMFTVWDQALL